MRVDLSRDPMFGRKQSPVKELKQRQLERDKQLRIKRMNPSFYQKNNQLDIEIIDPLPIQLKTYRAQTQIKNMRENSKASRSLKKYVIQQERNLKYLRLNRIDDSRALKESRAATQKLKLFDKQINENHQKTQQIQIPKIEEIFKEQQKQYIMFESRAMKNTLTKAMNSIDQSINKINSNYSYTERSSFPKEAKKTNSILNKTLVRISTPNDQDIELSDLIEKKLKKSQILREKLAKQKKQMTSNQVKQGMDSSNAGLFLVYLDKPKKKVMLQGIKHVSFTHGDKQLKITPASSLLFELNNLYNQRDKKQRQLQGLLKNSFQNREDILNQKSFFYDQQTPFKDLSPSNQFKLRRQMDRRLALRLELSRQQVHSFINYIIEIRQQYHVILNAVMLEILHEIRAALMNGKVMKKSDFLQIIRSKDSQQLKEAPNPYIVTKLHQMMI